MVAPAVGAPAAGAAPEVPVAGPTFGGAVWAGVTALLPKVHPAVSTPVATRTPALQLQLPVLFTLLLLVLPSSFRFHP
jgi:hypothetical protein